MDNTVRDHGRTHLEHISGQISEVLDPLAARREGLPVDQIRPLIAQIWRREFGGRGLSERALRATLVRGPLDHRLVTPMSVHPASPALPVPPSTPPTGVDADGTPRTPGPARTRAGASERADRRPAWLSMEAPDPGLWLLRVAGRLDTATAARVLR